MPMPEPASGALPAASEPQPRTNASWLSGYWSVKVPVSKIVPSEPEAVTGGASGPGQTFGERAVKRAPAITQPSETVEVIALVSSNDQPNVSPIAPVVYAPSASASMLNDWEVAHRSMSASQHARAVPLPPGRPTPRNVATG